MLIEKKSYKELLDEVPGYLAKVVHDSRSLIEARIWDSISMEQLESWLRNFESDEERLLSGLMLESLIFRSSAQTKALLYNAIESVLPNIVIDNPWAVIENESYLDVLTSRNELKHQIRLVPVIRDSDPPTKSGPLVARLYRRHVNVSDKFMIWPWQIKESYEKKVSLFVFIDDVVGTGEQFSEFLRQYKLDQYADAIFVYVPLLACHKGIENIQREFPFLRVGAVETIGNEYCFLNRPKVKDISDIEELYLKVEARKVNKRLLKKMSLGYKQLGLTFSFSHSTPNSSLPLYWYQDDKFTPLVRR